MLQKDDVGLIIRPNVQNKQWNGTVDVQAVVMPRGITSEDNQAELLNLIYGLVACFNLLNTDEAFAARVSEELDKMIEDGSVNVNPTGESNVIRIDQWSKTQGNA
jgi:hypothetical protein